LIDVIGEEGGPCRKQADVLFLIDTTSNMDYDYFQRYMLGFVNDVIQQLEVDAGRTRVAVVSFSDRAQVSQNPDSHCIGADSMHGGDGAMITYMGWDYK